MRCIGYFNEPKNSLLDYNFHFWFNIYSAYRYSILLKVFFAKFVNILFKANNLFSSAESLQCFFFKAWTSWHMVLNLYILQNIISPYWIHRSCSDKSTCYMSTWKTTYVSSWSISPVFVNSLHLGFKIGKSVKSSMHIPEQSSVDSIIFYSYSKSLFCLILLGL